MTRPEKRQTLKVLISTGHLGTAPSSRESFMLGMAANPDYVVADGGSSDPGPVYLGEDTTLGHFVREELELFLTESRKKGIPLVIGSAGDTGSNRGVDEFVSIIQELAQEHRIPKFKVGYFYSEVSKDFLKKKLRDGKELTGLGGFPALTAAEINLATRVVAVAGIHPFLKLLEQGADVIIAGRCGISTLPRDLAYITDFRSAGLSHGKNDRVCVARRRAVHGQGNHHRHHFARRHQDHTLPPATAVHHRISGRAFDVRARDAYFEHTLGGTLDMRACNYEQFDERTVRISGAAWIPAKELRVKIEGAKKVGERYMGFVGLRDPHVIRNVDAAIEWCKSAVAKRFGQEQYELYFHVFGKNAVLKELEPVRTTSPHELGIVVEGLANSDALAEKITDFAVRMFFLVRIPGVKGTAGTAATTKKTMKSSPGYLWNVNHTVPIDDPMELFPVHMTEAGV
jgi:hypothetical protein